MQICNINAPSDIHSQSFDEGRNSEFYMIGV